MKPELFLPVSFPIYIIPGTHGGLLDFIEMIKACRNCNLPLVVFKVPLFRGYEIHAYDYRFHTKTFTANLLLKDLKELDHKKVDALIRGHALIMSPLSDSIFPDHKEKPSRTRKVK